jgi:hypothetical protein
MYSAISVRRGLIGLFAAVLLLEGSVAVLPHDHHSEVVLTSCGSHHHDHSAAWVAMLEVEGEHECLACSTNIPASASPPEVRHFESPRPVSLAVVVQASRSVDSRLSDTSPRGPPHLV